MSRLSIRFERIVSDHKPLCFLHAVQAAHAGVDIEVTVEEDAGGEQDMRQQHCQACADDENKMTGIASIDVSPEGMERFKKRMQEDLRIAERKGQLADRICELEKEKEHQQLELASAQRALEDLFRPLGINVDIPAGVAFKQWLRTEGAVKMVEKIMALRCVPPEPESYVGSTSFDNLVYYAMGSLVRGEKDYNIVLDIDGRFRIEAGWAMEAVRQAKEHLKNAEEKTDG